MPPRPGAKLCDRDLLGRARDGDPGAVADLVAEVRRVVCRYADARLRTYAGGRELAEDVAQEVCVAVLARLPGHRGDGAPFAALVYAIASNKVADAQRRQARTRATTTDDLPELVDDAAGPEQQVLTRLDVQTVRDLLGQLPPLMAQVVRLRAEGLSAADVGRLTGLTPGAVRVRQHRALRLLRALAEGEAGAGRPTVLVPVGGRRPRPFAGSPVELRAGA